MALLWLVWPGRLPALKGQKCVNRVHCPSRRIDPYGFERPHDYESYQEMMNEYVGVLNRRSLRWSRLLQESPQVQKSLTGDPSPRQHTSAPGSVSVFASTNQSFSK